MINAFLFLAVAVQSPNNGERFESYLAHVFSAQASLDIGDSSLALRWLDKAPAEYRGWEYDFLSLLPM